MIDLVPGPLALVDPASLAPFPMQPSFEGLVVNHLGGLAGADAVLGGAAVDASSDPPVDLESTFAATIGAAQDAANNEDATTPPSPIPNLLGAVDNADARRVAAQAYLPGPDAPIEQTFDPPPDPPPDLLAPPPPPGDGGRD